MGVLMRGGAAVQEETGIFWNSYIDMERRVSI